MACEPQYARNLFQETISFLNSMERKDRPVLHDVDFAAITSTRSLIAFAPLPGQPKLGGEHEQWTILLVDVNAVLHMVGFGRNNYGADAIHFGRFDLCKRPMHVLEIVSRLTSSFMRQHTGHGHYIHHETKRLTETEDGVFGVEDIFSLKPGPYTLYLHRASVSGWTCAPLEIKHDTNELNVDNIQEAMKHTAREYLRGL